MALLAASEPLKVPSERETRLYRAANDLLEDGCPGDDAVHYCELAEVEQEDEDLCKRCWGYYLARLFVPGAYTTDGHA